MKPSVEFDTTKANGTPIKANHKVIHFIRFLLLQKHICAPFLCGKDSLVLHLTQNTPQMEVSHFLRCHFETFSSVIFSLLAMWQRQNELG